MGKSLFDIFDARRTILTRSDRADFAVDPWKSIQARADRQEARDRAYARSRVNMAPYREHAVEVGRARALNGRGRTDTVDPRRYGMTGGEEHIIGAAGEIALCVFFGLDPGRHVQRGDPGDVPDLAHPDGRTFQVKTPSKHRWYRRCNWVRTARHGPALRTDYAVLAWPEPRGFITLVGALAREEYNALVQLNERMRAPAYFVEWGAFHPITILEV